MPSIYSSEFHNPKPEHRPSSTSEYLYGSDPSAWYLLPYDEALEVKLELALCLQEELQVVSYLERDYTRVNKIAKAIKDIKDQLYEISLL
jgi:hypothetical protein